MSALPIAPSGRTLWIERRASRLAVAYRLSQWDALQEAAQDYAAFQGTGGLCDDCPTKTHCDREGCVALVPTPSAAEAGAQATRFFWKAVAVIATLLLIGLLP